MHVYGVHIRLLYFRGAHILSGRLPGQLNFFIVLPNIGGLSFFNLLDVIKLSRILRWL
jgi:hypothetical protein